MAVSRWLVPALVGGMVSAAQLSAQATTGTISGRVTDSTSQQGLSNVTVSIPGTQRGTLTRDDGGYTLAGVPTGSQRVRVSRIGYRSGEQVVNVTAGGTATADFTLAAAAAQLSAIVTTGYGTQRRESISGSVAVVDAEQANVGVQPNANGLLTARVAGVNVIANNGEPGGGVQVRVRGGTSLSASNTPLYVIDGVPIQNEATVARGVAIGGSAALDRSPLNSLNPNDIQSITVLKDASATAIYGSRGANGVVLIETKKGASGASSIEYETYVGAATPARSLDFATASQYRSLVEQQITAGGLSAEARGSLGTASTDWEDEVTRVGIAQNHNLTFSGGSQTTQYRAALNYFDQQGVVINNGLKRYQGRINAQTQAFTGRLQTGLNLTASRVNNTYLPFDNTAGFDGGIFTNVAVFNPTQPVYVTGPGGAQTFYEVGAGAQSVRNPVALARQITDVAPENRVLGNLNASWAIVPSLTARTTVGIDYANSVRQTYFPLTNPVGASTSGRARQAERSVQNVNFQGLLTFAPEINVADVEILGGYEFTEVDNRGFEAEARGFRTDAFRFDNLSAGTLDGAPAPGSYIQESRLVSFFSRANLGFSDKYFLTGVVRYDGSSRLAPGNKWSLFPAISGSWRLSNEDFLRDGFFSNLSLRAGWGRQGNQAVDPYGTQLLLRTNNDARYPFGGTVITGFAATQVANPDLKWETSEQTNIGLDYGFSGDRFTGTFEIYQKDTKDLLLRVPVAQPAVVADRLENVGSLRNRGFEATFDAQLLRGAGDQLSFTSGLVLAVERNEVEALGLDRQFIITGSVNGQGQSGRNAQRLIPGQPVGTFWGAEFVGFDAQGRQLFNKYNVTRDAQGRETGRTLNGTTTAPSGDDEVIIGKAQSDFSLGLRSNSTWRGFDASWLWRAEVGNDVFNNTALVYGSTTNAKQGRNFLASAFDEGDAFGEPAIYSSRWIEDGSFVRLQNVTVGYRFRLPGPLGGGRETRVYLSGDNLLLFSGYDGLDPEVFVDNGLAARGTDYLQYPRARTFTAGARVQF